MKAIQHQYIIVFEEADSDYDLPDFTGPFDNEAEAVSFARKTYRRKGVKGVSDNWYVAPLNPALKNPKL